MKITDRLDEIKQAAWTIYFNAERLEGYLPNGLTLNCAQRQRGNHFGLAFRGQEVLTVKDDFMLGEPQLDVEIDDMAAARADELIDMLISIADRPQLEPNDARRAELFEAVLDGASAHMLAMSEPWLSIEDDPLLEEMRLSTDLILHAGFNAGDHLPPGAVILCPDMGPGIEALELYEDQEKVLRVICDHTEEGGVTMEIAAAAFERRGDLVEMVREVADEAASLDRVADGPEM